MNIKGLGKHQRDMLEFFQREDVGLHSLSRDKLTKKVALSLENRGLITINKFWQRKN